MPDMKYPLTGPEDPRHGVTGYTYGCRCDVCKTAISALRKSEREAKRGTLAVGDSRHGTVTGYDGYGCRCDPCVAAHRAARAEHWAAAQAVGLPDPTDPRHGTLTGYDRGCRCDPCREVSRAYHRARRAARKASPK